VLGIVLTNLDRPEDQDDSVSVAGIETVMNIARLTLVADRALVARALAS
jgi:hypothetical protein